MEMHQTVGLTVAQGKNVDFCPNQQSPIA